MTTASVELSVQQRVDASCVRFEAAWKAHRHERQTQPRPQLEAYLEGAAETDRPLLLRELVLIDRAYREALGEVVTTEEYRARFPNDGQAIEEAFAPADRTLPDPRAEPDPGTQVPYFGDYELLGEIARGAMGVVYRARQISLNRVVALKMILAGRLATRAEVQRFRLEAESAALLVHEAIIPIHEVGEYQGRQYFTMRLVEGGTLAHQRERFLQDQRASAQLLAQVARAVHFAHQRGVLHRDLKPSNVLLDEQGRPVVADFGLAKRLGGPELTGSGAALGTPAYMAPEQAVGQKGVTTATDVYGLGTILYELLTGRPPFQGETTLETLAKVIAEEPIRPRTLDASRNADLETISLKCLEKDPRRRYRSALELAEELERWLGGHPILARPVGALERLGRWCQRNPVVAALLAALWTVLLAGCVTSTLLAVKAQQETRRAQENEVQAVDALAKVEEALAAGLLRPLGGTSEELNDRELDTLEELAQLPAERDRVRLLFIRQALARPATARQLGERLEEAVIATVGLRHDLREQILAEARERLNQAGPLEGLVTAADLIAFLEADDRDLVLQGARVSDLAGKISNMRELRRLVRGFVALVDRLPAHEAGQRTATLASRIFEEAMNTAHDEPEVGDMASAFKALASKLPPAEAALLASRIIERGKTIADPNQFDAWSRAIAALAERVPPSQAAILARRVRDLIVHFTDYHKLQCISLAWSALLGNLSASESSTLASELIAMADTISNDAQFRALFVFTTLADKIPQAEASKHATTLVRRMLDLVTRRLAPLGPGLAADSATRLVKYLPVAEVSHLASQMAALAARTTHPHEIERLAEALVTLMDRLPAAEAHQHSRVLGNRLVEISTKITQAYPLLDLAKSFLLLEPRLPAPEKGTIALALMKQFVDVTVLVFDARALEYLVDSFTRVLASVPAPEVATLLQRLVELSAKMKDEDQLKALARTCAALANKLPAEEAITRVTPLKNRLDEFVAQAKEPQELSRLVEASMALWDYFPPKEAPNQAVMLADRLLAVVPQATTASDLSAVPQALLAVARKLPEARVVAMTRRLVELAEKETATRQMVALLEGIARVAPLLPAAECAGLARQVLERMDRITEPLAVAHLHDAVGTWIKKMPATDTAGPVTALSSVTPKWTERRQLLYVGRTSTLLTKKLAAPEARQVASVVAPALARIMHHDRDDLVQRIAPILVELTAFLTPGQQLDLLKSPGCVGQGRQVLIQHIAREAGYRGTDFWGMVHAMRSSP
jgi:tRNA A-37 threonylcarbamoyl transferase component Bud32